MLGSRRFVSREIPEGCHASLQISSKVDTTSHSALYCPRAGHFSLLLFCSPGVSHREKTQHPSEATPPPCTEGVGAAEAAAVRQLQQQDQAMTATSEGCGARLLHSAGDCGKRNRADTQKDSIELFWLNYTGEVLGLQQCSSWI